MIERSHPLRFRAMRGRARQGCHAAAIAVAIVCGWGRAGAAIEMAPAYLRDATFHPLPDVHTIPDGLVALWREALSRSEAQLAIDAAQAVVRARRLGVANLDELAGPLRQALARHSDSPIAQTAIAQALIALDARDAAELLDQRAAVGSPEFAQWVEPALARWDYKHSSERWLARLGDARCSRRQLLLAIESLGVVREPRAAPRLSELVTAADTPADVRLAAARALATCQTTGLVAMARRVADDRHVEATARKLVAIALVNEESNPETLSLLMELAQNDEPAVVAAAVSRLGQLDSAAVAPLAERLRQSRDARVRVMTIELLAARPTPEIVATISALQGDPHPHVRAAASDALVRLYDQPPLAADVQAATLSALDGEDPLAQEQAALVAGEIGCEPAVERLLAKLDSATPRVAVAAAWALARVASPASGSAILAHIQREAGRLAARVEELRPIYAREETADIDTESLRNVYAVLEHLILAVGQIGYAPADPLLRTFLPKPIPEVREPPQLQPAKQAPLRAAAIWSLGHLHAGTPRADVVEPLLARLGDDTPIPAESPLVRQMAAHSLARMKAAQAIGFLRELYDSEAGGGGLNGACGWALEQLSGEPVPRPRARQVRHGGWFLEPLAN